MRLFILLVFVFASLDSFAGRSVSIQPFRPKVLNGKRTYFSPDRDVRLIYGFELTLFLVNHTSLEQNVTMEAVHESTSVRGTFTKDIGGGEYSSVAGEWFSWMCGPNLTINTGTSGTGIIGRLPNSLRFLIPPRGRVKVSTGIIFSKAVLAGDAHNGVLGEFEPLINLKIDEDRGVVSGYSVVTNRCYSPTGNRTCNGSLGTTPQLQCTFPDDAPVEGVAREIAGGRPF